MLFVCVFFGLVKCLWFGCYGVWLIWFRVVVFVGGFLLFCWALRVGGLVVCFVLFC